MAIITPLVTVLMERTTSRGMRTMRSKITMMLPLQVPAMSRGIASRAARRVPAVGSSRNPGWRLAGRLLAASVGLCFAGLAAAFGITFTTTSLGSDNWRYDYTLNLDAAAPAFDEFTIYFNGSSFASLVNPIGPPGWDAIAVQPDLAIPAEGFFDALRLGPPSPLATIPGFSVTFRLLSGDSPGNQQFELLNSADLTVVASGITEPGVAAPVPEPSTLLLVCSGLAGLAARRIHRKATT